MPFQFSLGSVLRIRLLHEEREERLLQSIFQEIARTHRSIESIDEEIVQMTANLMARISSVVAACNLHLYTSTVAALYEGKRALEKQLERLEQLKDLQMLNYQHARQGREIVSDLRIKKLTIHNSLLATREQKKIDDNFNSLRHRTLNHQ